MGRLRGEKQIGLRKLGRSNPAPLHLGLEEVTRGIWGGFHKEELTSAIGVVLRKYSDVEEIVVHMTARYNLKKMYGKNYDKKHRCNGCGFDAEDDYSLYVKRKDK